MPTTTDNLITTREQLFSLPSGSIVIINGTENARMVRSFQTGAVLYIYRPFSGNYEYAINKDELPEILTAKCELLWSPAA